MVQQVRWYGLQVDVKTSFTQYGHFIHSSTKRKHTLQNRWKTTIGNMLYGYYMIRCYTKTMYACSTAPRHKQRVRAPNPCTYRLLHFDMSPV